MLQKLLSHGNAPPPDARELRSEVSQDLVPVIDKMLAKIPADRYQTATDLIADLHEVAFRDGLVRSQALGPITISQPNPLVSWLETHAPWIVAAALLIASAGWLHLESAALRADVKISPTAERPLGTIPAAPDAVTTQPAFNAQPNRAGAEQPLGPLDDVAVFFLDRFVGRGVSRQHFEGPHFFLEGGNFDPTPFELESGLVQFFLESALLIAVTSSSLTELLFHRLELLA